MRNIDLSSFNNKDLGELIKYGDELYNSNLEGKIHAHKVYLTVLKQLPNLCKYPFSKLRGVIRQKIWNCEKFFHWNEEYFSQSGQDKIIKEFFFKEFNQKLTNGFFVEIGAYDGIMGSNCYHFEKYCNWDGVAIEPSNIQFKKLLNNRRCKVINKAIDKIERDIEFIEVLEGYTQMSYIKDDNNNNSQNILNKDNRTKIKNHKIRTAIFDKIIENKEISYLSIDTEGNELDILKSIDFEVFNIKIISIENNNSTDLRINDFLTKINFNYFDTVGVDQIYYNKKHYNFYN